MAFGVLVGAPRFFRHRRIKTIRAFPSRCFAIGLAALAASAACGCASDPEIVESAKSRDTSPKVSSFDADKLASDNAAFGLQLYEGLAKGQDNVFYSPYSISIALAMTYAGAAGETKAQMAKALHFDLPDARLHAAFDAIDLALAKRGAASADNGQPFKLVVAASLWGQKGLAFETPFLDTLAVDYGSGLRVADFEAAPDPSRTQINGWVADETADKIPELLPAGSIDENTRVVLVNAIYFNASWSTAFLKHLTSKAPFTTLGGAKVQVDTMSVAGEFQLAKGSGYQAAQLPYADRSTAMVIVLPDAGSFATIEGRLNGAFVRDVFKSLQTHSVSIDLPKFGIQGPTVSLKDQLRKLGMVDAFDAGKADFSAMVAKNVDQLYLTDVLHQAFVRVDESGTEAAAATAVTGGDLSGGPVHVERFRVDRPFLFFIRDIPTNTVLFAGRVTKPG